MHIDGGFGETRQSRRGGLAGHEGHMRHPVLARVCPPAMRRNRDRPHPAAGNVVRRLAAATATRREGKYGPAPHCGGVLHGPIALPYELVSRVRCRNVHQASRRGGSEAAWIDRERDMTRAELFDPEPVQSAAWDPPGLGEGGSPRDGRLIQCRQAVVETGRTRSPSRDGVATTRPRGATPGESSWPR